jgi:hypothetical protein
MRVRGWTRAGREVRERRAAARGGKSELREGRRRGRKESELLHPTCVFLYVSPWRLVRRSL